MENLLKTSIENIASEGVVISAGVAEFKKENDKVVHSVFERADSLMYQQKEEFKIMQDYPLTTLLTLLTMNILNKVFNALERIWKRF